MYEYKAGMHSIRLGIQTKFVGNKLNLHQEVVSIHIQIVSALEATDMRFYRSETPFKKSDTHDKKLYSLRMV